MIVGDSRLANFCANYSSEKVSDVFGRCVQNYLNPYAGPMAHQLLLAPDAPGVEGSESWHSVRRYLINLVFTK
ncbi:hypothetical protein ACT2FY_03915 [Paraburkholderia fungorum]|uniref:hypothetical protein n=1 Tax=Paraburkholderia fungorum TaxID=134537 RepID=UPI00402B5393